MNQFKRENITLLNSIYGVKTLSAYSSGGLAIAKTGKEWSVYHCESGINIYYRLSRKTLSEAKTVVSSLLALPIKWVGTEAEVMKVLGKHGKAIRDIAENRG